MHPNYYIGQRSNVVLLPTTSGVARSSENFSRTFFHFAIIEILLHAYFEYFLDTVTQHIFSNKHC